MSPRRHILIAGWFAILFGGAMLALWFSGNADAVRFAAWRCKTNTCVGLVLGGAALLALGSQRRRTRAIGTALAVAATAIGVATLFEYVAGIDLGIDQLLATDWPFPESAAHPNRMSPNAALSFALLGPSFLMMRGGPRLARLGQLPALALLALDAAALVGYIYDATFLYKTGEFLRISPYTALAFVGFATGALALRPDVGVAARLTGPGLGAYISRRLLIPVIAVPIALDWLRLQGERLGWWREATGLALDVLVYITAIAALVLYLARSLDRTDAGRRRVEDELRAARDAASAANRTKDEFLAMLGHELRNPLAPIAHAIELMRIRDPGPRRERDIIERQVRHMTRLVDDLLDVSRIARGKIELARSRIELAAAIDDAVELVRPLVTERRHALSVEVEPGLAVHGDRARLVQIVSNLLNNAAKYTPSGGRIELVVLRDGDRAVIRCTDTGVGLPAALLPRVFEPFVQHGATIDRAMGGLGLGLAIVHSLVALHGGTVAVASDGEGKGAAFTVALPALEAPPAAAAEPVPRARRGATSPRRVLIVDDNEDAAELMGEALQLAGHTVQIAHDGARGLEIAAEFDPDCVMLDIGLPTIDGYDVARQIRRDDGQRHRTLVAITGYGQDGDVRRSLDAGFDHHLVKPVSLEVTLEIVANAVQS
jgi:signal transduction histidine kinase